MNKNRRLEISKLHEELDALLSRAESLRDEEQEYFDNMPEAFQGSSKGEAAEEAIGHLDYVVDGIQQAIDSCGEVE